MAKLTLILTVLMTLMLSAFNGAAYSSPPPVSTVVAARSTAPASTYAASFSCVDINTPVQKTVCENQQLAALDVQLVAVYHRHLGTADVFERDQLLAAQRGWLLSLPARCGLDTGSAPPASAAAVTCLSDAYHSQIAVLMGWRKPVVASDDLRHQAMEKYVDYKLFDYKESGSARSELFGIMVPSFIPIKIPNICTKLADRALAGLSDDGSIDPKKIDGAIEIAGSHGPVSAASPQGGHILVNTYQAGLYGGYEMRARSVALSGVTAPLLSPTSLGNYVRAWSNHGGRFGSLPSQTGDYGDIDVFTFQGQLLALITDTTGYFSPAAPGEAAVAGVFTIRQGQAAPTCLFETYLMPPPLTMGPFSTQHALTPLLKLIDSIQGEPSDALAPSDRQDTYNFERETRWMVLNMPLLTLAQTKSSNWAGWLRRRHDQVLTSLYEWSQKSSQNRAMFNALFLLLRPAAAELQAIYVQQQGLRAKDAQQSTAITMMELLYQSTINFAPGLGGEPADPSALVHYKPQYPILARPQ